MKSLGIYFSSLLILFLTAGCAQINQPTSQPQPSQIAITATLTHIPNDNGASTTQTVTPIPPPTRRPTITAIGNLTATITPIASLTLAPTSKSTRTASATITKTSTRFVLPRGGGPTWTPVKSDLACSFVDRFTYPDFMQVFTPREDFVAYWKVVNSGKNMWHKDDIVFDFISGTKMANPARSGKILDYTVYVGDAFVVTMHMKPPKEPGVYTTSWGFRKTNKKDEFFCKLSVTIEIRKEK